MLNKGDLVKYKNNLYIVDENLGEGLIMITSNDKSRATSNPFSTIFPGVQLLYTLVVNEDSVEVITDDTGNDAKWI